MLGMLSTLTRPLLLGLEPETAHEATLVALERGLHPRALPDDPRLACHVMGLDFPNPIGMAAGFDKDARVPDALLAIGFGFAEAGTVTPRAQQGNPKPRVFRAIRERALINRLGFNNGGHAAARARLALRKGRGGIVGVNVGANKDTSDRAGDYVAGLETFYDIASYFTVNISSPNTPGLRDLQAPAALDALLARVMAARTEKNAAGLPRVPIVVKIAPDVAVDDLPAIVALMEQHGVDAIAVSNTTLARPAALESGFAGEAGGLSGRPLFHRATAMLARVHRLTGGRMPLIGIGGIDSGETALAKFEAGASLIQLYTGLIYEGPELVRRIKEHLLQALVERGASRLADLVGRDAERWAAAPLDG